MSLPWRAKLVNNYTLDVVDFTYGLEGNANKAVSVEAVVVYEYTDGHKYYSNVVYESPTNNVPKIIKILEEQYPSMKIQTICMMKLTN